MTTKAKAAPVPEAAAGSLPTRTRASELLAPVFEAIQAAGPEGVTLRDLAETTGIRYRVLHNVAWHLETKAETIRRVGGGRKVRYACVEAKPSTGRATARKSRGRASARVPSPKAA